jgi:hypothetical protein
MGVPWRGFPPNSVATKWQIVVGPGGQAGRVRLQLTPSLGDPVMSDPVDLPAEPGTYTFAAPHIRFRRYFNMARVALVQETGGHAVIKPEPDSSASEIIVSRAGQPDERIGHATLPIELLTEPDADEDGLGDTTEDRSDLRIAAAASREADGRGRLEVRITNAGPVTANLTGGTMSPNPGWHWDGCQTAPDQPSCLQLGNLAPGQTYVAVTRTDTTGPITGEVSVAFSGTETAPADNRASFALAAAPPMQLFAAHSQHLRSGVKFRVSAVRSGRVRATVTYKRTRKTIKVERTLRLAPLTLRDVTIHPVGTKLRALRHLLAKGPVSARLTVRAIGGGAPVTTKLRITR